jgi:glycosyltransferase involved in cell wall biosynthesis
MGGAEKFCSVLVEHLEQKHDVTVVTTNYIKEKSYPVIIDAKKEIVPRKFKRGMFFDEILLIWRLRKLPRPDLVFFSSYYPLGIIFKKFYKCKIGMYVHRPERTWPAGRLKRITYRNFIDKLEGISYRHADILYANSSYTRSLITKLDPVNCGVCYFPIDNEYLKFPISDDHEDYLLSINRFHMGKTLELAIECFSYLSNDFPELKLILAGFLDDTDPDVVNYFSSLKQMVSKLKLDDRIKFRINLSNQQINELYTHAKILLYTAQNEPCGIGQLIGQLFQIPVVVNNSGGIQETVEHRVTGLILSPDAKIWADEITKLLRDPELMQQMGINGRKRILDHYTWEHTLQPLLDDIDKLEVDNNENLDRS